MKMRWLPAMALAVWMGVCACGPDKALLRKQGMAIRKIGEAYMRQENYPLAYREFMKAQALYPDDPNLHYDLGLFFMQKNRPQRAVEAFETAIELKPDFPTARNNLGVAYLKLKDWDRAIAVLSTLVEDNYVYTTPQFPLFLLGRAYYHKKQYPQAIENFKKALDAQEDYVYASVWLGRTYMVTGRLPQAMKVLETARETAPEFADTYYWLANGYLRLHDDQRALAAYRKVLQLAPNSEIAGKARVEMGLIEE